MTYPDGETNTLSLTYLDPELSRWIAELGVESWHIRKNCVDALEHQQNIIRKIGPAVKKITTSPCNMSINLLVKPDWFIQNDIFSTRRLQRMLSKRDRLEVKNIKKHWFANDYVVLQIKNIVDSNSYPEQPIFSVIGLDTPNILIEHLPLI